MNINNKQVSELLRHILCPVLVTGPLVNLEHGLVTGTGLAQPLLINKTPKNDPLFLIHSTSLETMCLL